MSAGGELVLVANARMPSQRAQSLQIAQVAASFERCGVRTTLLHARRVPTPALPPGQTLFDYYAVGPGPRPDVVAVPCTDWIDRVPRRLQFWPARVQEHTFAANAARSVLASFPRARVLSREAETALRLVRGGHGRVFLEVHSVPARARRRALAEALAGVRGAIAISRGVADDLAEIDASAAVLVEHDGVEATRLEGGPTREEARAELGLGADERVVVYTGGLLAWKGADVLVAAARRVSGATFLVAGGMDADVAQLRERAAGAANVRLDGFQPPARVPLYLAAADVGVVPNRSEPAISARYTSPLKVFEAMAARLPLVVSDLPSLRDVLVPGRDAVFVAPDDPAALAAGIERVLGDEALRARLAARMRERAPAHTWDARARRVLAWMDALAEDAA